MTTTPSEELMEVPQQSLAPSGLFGTSDPVAVLEQASKVAGALANVLNQQKLFAVISGRKHVTIEGWTLLGSMLGVFAQIEWTKPTVDALGAPNGWEARAVATTLAGAVVGAGEGMCTRAEGTWKSRDDYALRAMAQTRALSRALRGPLDFVVKLAGYETTPAAEMPSDVKRPPDPSIIEAAPQSTEAPRPRANREPSTRVIRAVPGPHGHLVTVTPPEDTEASNMVTSRAEDGELRPPTISELRSSAEALAMSLAGRRHPDWAEKEVTETAFATLEKAAGRRGRQYKDLNATELQELIVALNSMVEA